MITKNKTFKNCYFYDAEDHITIDAGNDNVFIIENELIKTFTTGSDNQVIKLKAYIEEHRTNYTFLPNKECPYIQ